MAEQVTPEQVIAFRLAAHNLSERLAHDDALDATRPCGIPNSPPGSALTALHARVHDVSANLWDALIVDDRTLLQTWAMRGAPFCFPADDAAVFTTGVLPPTEKALRHFIPGVEQSVDRLGLSVRDAVDMCHTCITDVLPGRRLAVNALGAELAQHVRPRLTQSQRTVWDGEGPHARGQPVGEAVVHFCLRILTLERVVCLAPRDGNTAPFVLVDEWLDHPASEVNPDDARAELLRRYLHCYGPSTRADFAAWIGLRTGDIGTWWDLVVDDLTEVEFGRAAWVLTEDMDTLRSPLPRPTGIRLLPPRDPYTQMRDRDTIVATHHQREVWKGVGEPGTVLVDGAIAGIWRPGKRGRTLTVTVTTFDSLPARRTSSLEDEAERVAALRGADAAHLSLDPG